MEELDKGRMKVCEFIAEEYPYAASEIYWVYENLRKKSEKKGKPISFNQQIRNTKSVLDLASTFGIPLHHILTVILSE